MSNHRSNFRILKSAESPGLGETIFWGPARTWNPGLKTSAFPSLSESIKRSVRWLKLECLNFETHDALQGIEWPTGSSGEDFSGARSTMELDSKKARIWLGISKKTNASSHKAGEEWKFNCHEKICTNESCKTNMLYCLVRELWCYELKDWSFNADKVCCEAWF